MDETLEKLTLEKRKTRQLTATNRGQEIQNLKLEQKNREQRHKQVTELGRSLFECGRALINSRYDKNVDESGFEPSFNVN